MGLAVGFGVPIGGQMLALGMLRMLFRFNVWIAFAFTWVNNPLSLIPMYYGYYYVGSLLLGRGDVLTAESFRHLMYPILHADYFWQAFTAFGTLGCDILCRWSVSACLVGVLAGTVGYMVGYLVQSEHCRRKAREMGVTYEQLVTRWESALKSKERGQSGINPDTAGR